MRLFRTNSSNPDFLKLVRLLDAELAERDGDDHSFYSQYNGLDEIRNVLLCYKDIDAVACGGMKELSSGSLEIKRMYVEPSLRGRGLASLVLRELEQWAVELGYGRIVLETGKRQPEAIRLYEKNGYERIANYGPYHGIANSICFEKNLSFRPESNKN